MKVIPKVKVRLQGSEKDVARLRALLLKKCPELILAKPRKGTNPKYASDQKYASYGDFKFGVIRNRRGD